MTEEIELVVARCREDTAWVKRIPPGIRATIYDKSGESDTEDVERLPNIGREAHTYLYHIVRCYENPAALTVFSQGKPFDHVPDFHRVLRQVAAGTLRVGAFRWLGFIIDRDDRKGSLLFRHCRGNGEGRALGMDEFCRALGRVPVPESFVFYPGAHFIVSADAIRRRSRSFYEKALDLSATLPDAAHGFERCWDWIFGADGIPPPFRNAELPVYLRPVRRLGLTWADVAANRRLAESSSNEACLT